MCNKAPPQKSQKYPFHPPKTSATGTAPKSAAGGGGARIQRPGRWRNRPARARGGGGWGSGRAPPARSFYGGLKMHQKCPTRAKSFPESDKSDPASACAPPPRPHVLAKRSLLRCIQGAFGTNLNVSIDSVALISMKHNLCIPKSAPRFVRGQRRGGCGCCAYILSLVWTPCLPSRFGARSRV